MATNKSVNTAEDVVGILLSPKVVERLAKALAPIIAQSIEANVTKRIEDLTVAVRELKDSNIILTQNNEELKKENQDLRERINDNANKIEMVDKYARSYDIIISGIPETTYAGRASGGTPTTNPTFAENSTALEHSVIKLFNDKLGIDVRKEDIAIAHRLKKGANDTYRPTIVRFTTRKVRDRVFYAKRELKNLPKEEQIFISEHLTKEANNLFFVARKMRRERKLSSVWTNHGDVYVKATSEASEKPTIARTIKDMEECVAKSRR